MIRTASAILLCLSGAAQAQTVSPSGPVVPPIVPPIVTAVDPVARALAEQALKLASSPTITKSTIVGTSPLTNPPSDGGAGTIPMSPIQLVGSDPDLTGYLGFKFGNDAKGVTNYWVKTRGPTMNSYGAGQAGDRIVVDLWQVGTGSYQTGHAGGTAATVDSNTYTVGEVAGRWAVSTGTGITQVQASTRQYPQRYGVMNAIVLNSYQQAMFPGGAYPGTPDSGVNFGGWVVIGAGAASPGFGPLKFVTTNALLLTTPEPGAFEVDATAKPYFTAADGVRRSFVLADTSAPTVRALGSAGAGASVRIDASGSSGIVTLTTGTGTVAGDLFTVTYAHPYPSASYPVISAANAAAVAVVRGGYLTATASGFTVSVPAGSGATPGTTYAITFAAPGR